MASGYSFLFANKCQFPIKRQVRNLVFIECFLFFNTLFFIFLHYHLSSLYPLPPPPLPAAITAPLPMPVLLSTFYLLEIQLNILHTFLNPLAPALLVWRKSPSQPQRSVHVCWVLPGACLRSLREWFVFYGSSVSKSERSRASWEMLRSVSSHENENGIGGQ